METLDLPLVNTALERWDFLIAFDRMQIFPHVKMDKSVLIMSDRELQGVCPITDTFQSTSGLIILSRRFPKKEKY